MRCGAEVANPRWAIGEALRGLTAGFGLAGLAAATACGLAGLVSYLRQSRLLIVLFLGPGCLMAIAPLLSGRPTFPRFFFFLIGFATLVAVRGASAIGAGFARLVHADPIGLPRWQIGAALALIAASAVPLLSAFGEPKQDFEAALAFVEKSSHAEPVATVGLASFPFERYYGKTWPAVNSVEELRMLRRRSSRVWLVYTFPAYIDSELRETLARECRPARVFPATIGGGDIIVCSIEALPDASQSTSR